MYKTVIDYVHVMCKGLSLHFVCMCSAVQCGITHCGGPP